MREFGRYFKMSLDDDEEFLFDRVDVNANKIFNDIKLTFDDAVDLLNEKDKRIKRLENQLKHCEYQMAKSQQSQENLVSEIKNRIKYLQQTEFKYMESERLISIIELEWMLSLISSGSYEVYETEKIIDEIK